ncbi:hypothetical protein LSH36_279g03145 [Paralvinella palmiformis]|uniref:Uncharacterized protein n=1 Tax=Paralvinella palmiformis TaxID=53620 RepID=A0AAD9JIW0_9ANNE|nr:hypothetical protein LSH36_279g03145 [Paralvinella palmiformis]
MLLSRNDLITQLQPIIITLDQCRGDSYLLGDACYKWIQLQCETLLNSHYSTVNKRFMKTITIEHLVAYELHPKYQGSNLDPEQMEDINRHHLFSQNQEFVPLVIAHQAKSSLFPASFFLDNTTQMNPIIWWKPVEKCHVLESF